MTTMRLVVQRAGALRKISPTAEIEDLANEGSIGLLRAIEKFDATKGAGFAGYARFWIDHLIRDSAWRDRGVSRTSVSRQGIAREYRTALDGGLGHESAVEHAAAVAGVKPETARRHIDAIQRPTHRSLDAPLAEDGPPLGDTIAAPGKSADAAMAEEEKAAAVRSSIAAMRKRLKPREQAILDRRILAHEDDAATLREMGDAFDVVPERIRQIEKQLRRKLSERIRRSTSVRRALEHDVTAVDVATYMRDRRARHIEAGICSACLSPAKPGMRMCGVHLAKYRKSGLAWRRSKGQRQKPSVLITHDNRTLSASEWSRRTGLSVSLLLYRFHAGWSADRVLSLDKKPGMPRRTQCVRGHDLATVGRHTQGRTDGSGSCRACKRVLYVAKRFACALAGIRVSRADWHDEKLRAA